MMETKTTMIKLSKAVGMSRHGLRDAMDKNTMKVQTLIDIATFFGVPVTYFLDDKEAYSKTDVDKVMKVMADIIKERI